MYCSNLSSLGTVVLYHVCNPLFVFVDSFFSGLLRHWASCDVFVCLYVFLDVFSFLGLLLLYQMFLLLYLCVMCFCRISIKITYILWSSQPTISALHYIWLHPSITRLRIPQNFLTSPLEPKNTNHSSHMLSPTIKLHNCFSPVYLLFFMFVFLCLLSIILFSLWLLLSINDDEFSKVLKEIFERKNVRNF